MCVSEIELAHARVGGDLGGRASVRTRPPASTVIRCANRNTSDMSCSMRTMVISGGQQLDGLEQLRALARGNAGGGLVEEQHARLAGQGQRDLEQPLLAVGELARDAVRRRRRAQRFEQARAPRAAPPVATTTGRSQSPHSPRRSQTASATDSSTVRPRKQRVHLERARQAPLDARVRRQCVMRSATQHHLARVGAQHAR